MNGRLHVLKLLTALFALSFPFTLLLIQLLLLLTQTLGLDTCLLLGLPLCVGTDFLGVFSSLGTDSFGVGVGLLGLLSGLGTNARGIVGGIGAELRRVGGISYTSPSVSPFPQFSRLSARFIWPLCLRSLC